MHTTGPRLATLPVCIGPVQTSIWSPSLIANAPLVNFIGSPTSNRTTSVSPSRGRLSPALTTSSTPSSGSSTFPSNSIGTASPAPRPNRWHQTGDVSSSNENTKADALSALFGTKQYRSASVPSQSRPQQFPDQRLFEALAAATNSHYSPIVQSSQPSLDMAETRHSSRHRSQSSADYGKNTMNDTPIAMAMPRSIGRTTSMPPGPPHHAASLPTGSAFMPMPIMGRQMPTSTYGNLSMSPDHNATYDRHVGGRSWTAQSNFMPASFGRNERESRWTPIDIATNGMYLDGGIASTNVSPFTRDASFLPTIYDNIGHSSRQREHSLGPVGSGRRRGDPVWGAARSLAFTHERVEDDNSDEEYAPPTRSGATSRRHSLATLPGRSQQVGFSVPDLAPMPMSAVFNRSPRMDQALGGLRLSDDDLAASLNSLQLSMAAEKADMLSRSPTDRRGFNNGPFQPQQTRQFPQGAAGNGNGDFFQRGPSQINNSRNAPSLPMQQQGFSGQNLNSAMSNLDINSRPVYFGAQTVQEPDIAEFGRGIPLHAVPPDSPLFIVEFKGGRTDIFYIGEPGLTIRQRDVVIVEADRGKDLGTVVHDSISLQDVQSFQQHQVEQALGQLAAPQNGPPGLNQQTISRLTREVHPKRILSKASQTDLQLLSSKAADEAKALMVCRNKVVQKGLEMEITDAEWQFDRRKLTLFYIADKRIDLCVLFPFRKALIA